jgi:hypothetical protein
VPNSIEQAILAISDPSALDLLLDHAIDSVSLGEFKTALR